MNKIAVYLNKSRDHIVKDNNRMDIKDQSYGPIATNGNYLN